MNASYGEHLRPVVNTLAPTHTPQCILTYCIVLQFEPYDDVAEEFKIKCFVSMVSKCKHVALPYYSTQQVGKHEFTAMNIEQWPIVQAYALEEYGRWVYCVLGP